MSVQNVIRDYPLEPAVIARATRVDINFTDDFSVLEIRDDGLGVSSDEFKSEYLRISGSKRRLGGNIAPITNRSLRLHTGSCLPL